MLIYMKITLLLCGSLMLEKKVHSPPPFCSEGWGSTGSFYPLSRGFGYGFEAGRIRVKYAAV
jgi:hypothetical protein